MVVVIRHYIVVSINLTTLMMQQINIINRTMVRKRVTWKVGSHLMRDWKMMIAASKIIINKNYNQDHRPRKAKYKMNKTILTMMMMMARGYKMIMKMIITLLNSREAKRKKLGKRRTPRLPKITHITKRNKIKRITRA